MYPTCENHKQEKRKNLCQYFGCPNIPSQQIPTSSPTAMYRFRVYNQWCKSPTTSCLSWESNNSFDQHKQFKLRLRNMFKLRLRNIPESHPARWWQGKKPARSVMAGEKTLGFCQHQHKSNNKLCWYHTARIMIHIPPPPWFLNSSKQYIAACNISAQALDIVKSTNN